MLSESLIDWATATAERRGLSVSALVREALELERARSLEQQLAREAESLASLYESDQELTAFTALDAEEFA